MTGEGVGRLSQREIPDRSSARAAGLLEGVVLAGLFALPLLALFVTPLLYFPYVTARGFAFRAIVALAAACWAGLALIDPRYRPRRSVLLWCFIAALAALAAADALGDDPARSLYGNLVRMEGYAMLLHLFALFVVAGAVLSTERRWTRYFATSVAASVLVAVLGLMQRWGYYAAPWGPQRIDATFGNPAYLAAYLLINVFLAAFLLVRAERRLTRVALGSALALDLAVLWLTATRGAVVGLIAGIVVAALVMAWRAGEGTAKRRGAALVAALVVLGSAGLFAARHAPLLAGRAVLERFAAIGPGDATVDLRFRIWGMAWQAIRDRPLLGWGQENFASAADRHFDPVLSHDSEWVDRAHNLVLDWLVAGGAVGGVAYLSLFAAALWLLWRAPGAGDAGDAMLSGLIAGYFVNTLFLFDSAMSYLLFVSVLAYLHARAVRGREAHRAVVLAPGLRRLGAAAAAAGLVAALGLDARGLFAAAALHRAQFAQARPVVVVAKAQGSMTLTPAARSDDALIAMRDDFRQAIDYGSLGTQDAREAFGLAAYALVAGGGDPWVRKNFAPAAVAALQAEVRAHPEARDMLFLGALLVALGRNDDAIAVLDQAVTLAPRRQSLHMELAAAYQGNGDMAQALGACKDAFELDPTFDTARIDYAAAAIASGDEALGQRLLVERYGTELVPDDRLIAAYAAIKRDDKVIALWRMRVASDPDNANDRIQLAGALMRAGRGTDAVKELGGLNRILTRPPGGQ
jgi:O-antigen ligase